MEQQKQEQDFISCVSSGRDYSPTEGGITRVPVLSGEGTVASVFVRLVEEGIAMSSVPDSLVKM